MQRWVDQIIQVRHLPVVIDKGTRSAVRCGEKTRYLPGIVEALAEATLAQGTQIHHLSVAEDKSMKSAIVYLRSTRHLPGIVDPAPKLPILPEPLKMPRSVICPLL